MSTTHSAVIWSKKSWTNKERPRWSFIEIFHDFSRDSFYWLEYEFQIRTCMKIWKTRSKMTGRALDLDYSSLESILYPWSYLSDGVMKCAILFIRAVFEQHPFRITVIIFVRLRTVSALSFLTILLLWRRRIWKRWGTSRFPAQCVISLHLHFESNNYSSTNVLTIWTT